MILITSVVVGLLLTGARCQYLSYNPDTYPDSEREWTLCRTPAKSLACDPNQLLNSVDGLEGVLKLNEALERVRQSTNCSCTNEDFPLGHCDFNPQGYTISIAVLYRIEGTPDTSDVDPAFSEQLASVFANAMRQRFRRGQCQDDVFIVLSLNNSAIWSSVGHVAGRRLTPSIVKTVSANAKQYFREYAYTEGLLYTVRQYEKILAGGTADDLDLYGDKGIWSILPLWAWISIGAVVLVGIVFTVALCVMCYVRRKRHSDGYTVGKEIYATSHISRPNC